MIFKYFPLLLLVLLSPMQTKGEKPEFRIVGYYPIAEAGNLKARIPFNRFTHINLWFVNPDPSGFIAEDYPGLARIIQKAHRNKVKVLISTGGGDSQGKYAIINEENICKTVTDNLIALTDKYDLDGIDIDLEGKDIIESYVSFVTGLESALRQRGKLLTAALSPSFNRLISDKSLEAFDFINIMSYDHTGPWDPASPGQHSSYDDAVDDLSIFADERKIPREKLVLGVPFYGYLFDVNGKEHVRVLTYSQIVKGYPGSETGDQVVTANNEIIYYNGINTIIRKTELALEKASGIMIWQPGGDIGDSRSLLKNIAETITKNRQPAFKNTGLFPVK